jgi:outer membrane protein TolC
MAELAARPDVRASEMELAKAFYATNLARAAFYPNLTISANGGFTNSAGSVIVNPGDWFIQLAGQLTAPLFSRGKNIATLEASKAAQKQAMNNFEYSLLNASAEVSDAMMVCQKSDEKVNLLNKQIENLEKSVEYTQELLTLGTSTYLEVLTAQQNLLAAQMSQLACEHTKTQAIINLYQSLGGGR